MSKEKEETIQAIRQMLAAYESLPDHIAEKICFELKMHRAETLEELRTVTDALPDLDYKPSNMVGEIDCLNASLSSSVKVGLFHRRVLNDQFVRQSPDLSLIQRDRAGVA